MPFSISKPASFLSVLLMLGVVVSTFANVFGRLFGRKGTVSSMTP
jgi:TRAP-type C4-dicarboxylate transport system permease small subunit